ncbi:centromere protein S isoform X2 [Rhinolophus sinicus]|uniref:centromere protein S isoform X2 n=1 Tax=Rhinolophus sinicus TaxID=89399 RepID=UPI003D7AE614
MLAAQSPSCGRGGGLRAQTQTGDSSSEAHPPAVVRISAPQPEGCVDSAHTQFSYVEKQREAEGSRPLHCGLSVPGGCLGQGDSAQQTDHRSDCGENFAKDLEMFARHAKRSTINTEDVKLLARRSNSLLRYITEKNEEIAQFNLERKAKKKKKLEDENDSVQPAEAEVMESEN